MNTDNNMQAKPFVKWIGGKTQLLSQLRDNYPQELSNGSITTYIEPFIGGGSVFFDIMRTFSIENSVINDINPNLVNCYRTIRDCPDDIISELTVMQEKYLARDSEGRAKFYYDRRDNYNDVITNGLDDNDIMRAALLIFLNKTCFNGLYRVNKSGKFNAAHGRYPKPTIVDVSNIYAVNNVLMRTEILLGDYQNVHPYVDDKTFMYLDPPYRPLTRTANFASYDLSGFDDTAQYRLGDFIAFADKQEAKILMSNSDPKNHDSDDDFFDNLYSDYNISRVSARRSVSVKGDTRGAIKEVLIKNYQTKTSETLFTLLGIDERD